MDESASLVLGRTKYWRSQISPAVWKIEGMAIPSFAFMAFFPFLFRVQEHAFFVFLVLAVAIRWYQSESPWIRTPIDVPLLAFAGWVLLTVPFSINPWYSLGEWRKLMAGILFFYWVVLILHQNGGRFETRYLMRAVVGGAAVLCTYALYDFVVHGGSWQDRAAFRARAIGSDSNWLGTYMVMVLPLIVVVTLVGARTRKEMFIYGSMFMCVMAALVTSYMRAAWLAFLVECLTLSVISGSRKLRSIILAVSMAAVLGFYVMVQAGYHVNTISSVSLELRVAVWEKGLEGMRSNPTVGAGYGNYIFRELYGEFLAAAPPIRGSKWLDHPHSYFLMIGMGSGVPALMLIVWVFWTAGKTLVAGIRRQSDVWTRRFITGVLVMMMGFITRNLFDYMFAGSLAYLFWLLLGAGVYHCMTASTEGSIARRPESAPASLQTCVLDRTV